ncbi:MAG: hypothetical protein IPO21_18630 [Bacteroidales bacterium]|nr:hypothetical protein [Bacteroidales bacterium]
MRHLNITSVIISLFTIGILTYCKKPNYNPYPYIGDRVNPGEEVIVDHGVINNTVNMEGGDATIVGNTVVNADINVKSFQSELLIADSVSLHKINMHGGLVRLVGSPIIRTDFNINQGKVIIGSDKSRPFDTVRVKNNLNLFDSLWVEAGVLVIEKDFNHNGFVSIADSAKILVLHDMNKGGDLYGRNRVEVRGAYNDNQKGITTDAPYIAPNNVPGDNKITD